MKRPGLGGCRARSGLSGFTPGAKEEGREGDQTGRGEGGRTGGRALEGRRERKEEGEAEEEAVAEEEAGKGWTRNTTFTPWRSLGIL